MDGITKSYIAAGALLAGGLAVYGLTCAAEPSAAAETAVEEGPELPVKVLSALLLVLATASAWFYFKTVKE